MSFATSVSLSVVVCVLAAALEGACAGRNVRPFFAQLQFPPYSAPLWVWSIIGGVYYLIFGFVTYRLLRLSSESPLTAAVLMLILFMMAANAATNYIIFRARNLRLSFIVGCLFPLLDISLFTCVVRLDTIAAGVISTISPVSALCYLLGLSDMETQLLAERKRLTKRRSALLPRPNVSHWRT